MECIIAKMPVYLLELKDGPRCSKTSWRYAKIFLHHNDKGKHIGESFEAHLLSENCDMSVEGYFIKW